VSPVLAARLEDNGALSDNVLAARRGLIVIGNMRASRPVEIVFRVLDRAPAMLAYWDKDLRCRFANRAYEQWFGVDADSLLGTAIQDLLGPALFALNEPYMRAALRGKAQMFERVVPGPKGEQRPSLAHYLPDFVHGEVQGFVALVTDVSPLKTVELAMRDELRQLQLLNAVLLRRESALREAQRLSGVGSWTWVIDPAQLSWSEELYRLFGRDPQSPPPSEAEQRNLYSPASWTLLCSALDRLLRYGVPYALELEYVRGDGSIGWLEARADAERDASGNAVRLHGTAQDISGRKGNPAPS
jgi:PAS domain S-box-containing protein